MPWSVDRPDVDARDDRGRDLVGGDEPADRLSRASRPRLVHGESSRALIASRVWSVIGVSTEDTPRQRRWPSPRNGVTSSATARPAGTPCVGRPGTPRLPRRLDRDRRDQHDPAVPGLEHRRQRPDGCSGTAQSGCRPASACHSRRWTTTGAPRATGLPAPLATSRGRSASASPTVEKQRSTSSGSVRSAGTQSDSEASSAATVSSLALSRPTAPPGDPRSPGGGRHGPSRRPGRPR